MGDVDLSKIKLLIISDPLISGSVQLKLIKSIISNSKNIAEITIYSTYIEKSVEEETRNATFLSGKHRFWFYKLYRHLQSDNESMLWFYSWLRETVL
ncbi:MAG: hypothetical protein QXU18_13915, partial [Thermoplasmatales archaeon]